MAQRKSKIEIKKDLSDGKDHALKILLLYIYNESIPKTQKGIFIGGN